MIAILRGQSGTHVSPSQRGVAGGGPKRGCVGVVADFAVRQRMPRAEDSGCNLQVRVSRGVDVQVLGCQYMQERAWVMD